MADDAPDPTQETQTPDPAPTPDLPKEGKVISMPSKALNQRLTSAREQGRKAAMSDMEAKAKSLGFGSLAEMEKAAARARSARPANTTPAPQPRQPAPPPAPQPHDGSRSSKRLTRENERLLAKVREHNRARAVEERRRKAAEERGQALEAEMILRTTAIKAGVQDVDYGIELLRRRLGNLPAEELAKGFDEGKFFADDLRKSHPYLYGIEQRPAQTAAPESKQGAPAPKKPEAPPPTGQSNGQGSRDLTREKYLASLKSMGLTDPSSGL